MIKKRFLSILALLCLTVSGAWAGAIPPLITIESKDYTSFTSGSQTFDDKVTVTFSGNVNYDSEYGWFSAKERTLTVTAAEGYTITGVRFTNGSGSRFDGEAPFEAILGYDNDNGVYFAKVNGTSIGTVDAGVTKIEVYGNAVTPATVAVTGVTLEPTTATLTLGETETVTLTATVLPDDATDKSVTWSSSNEAVATVSNEGVVTAVAAGEATITVTATNGTDVTTDDQTATCTVTVAAPAPATYTVSLKEGTDDAAKWQGKAGTGEYQALPLEGVAAGTAVTVKYDGRKRVRSVKAVKKAVDPLAVPLTLEALTDGTIEVNISYPGGARRYDFPDDFSESSKRVPGRRVSSTISMKYSVNGGEKQAVTSDAITVSAGDRVQLYGNGPDLSNYGFPVIAGGTAQTKVYGNIMSMLDEDNYATLTTLQDLAFYALFGGNANLTDASGLLLPATTLAAGCYAGMFYGCESLTAAPALPATELAGGCYSRMFAACTSLTTAPALPATELAGDCYDNMFSGCTSLTTAPALPAETLAGTCYYEMFADCTSLTTAPALPATTLVEGCYYYMFSGCTSLTTAPTLPATTLVESCYSSMFKGCTSLTTAPTLPATTLANLCYNCMFEGCTSLVTAPALPVETLADNCYRNMFKGCTSLTTAPALPATTLADYCYRGMFSGCTSLTTAPVLPATTLANSCYNFMFSGCTSLNSVTCLATNISASNCTTSWLQNVATTGTFTKASGATSWPEGANGIPSGWTVNEQ